MGVHNVSSSTNLANNIGIVTTAETTIIGVGPFSCGIDNAQVLIYWEAVITLAAGTTSVTPRIRRGFLITDTVVNKVNAITAAASTTIKLAGVYSDVPGVTGNLQYSLTLQMAGASANATVVDANITALVL